MRFIVLLALFIPLACSAQVRKCVDSTGKTVYSDVVCADTKAKETTVDTSANNIDHSGLRQQAANDKAQADAIAAKEKADSAKALRHGKPDPCGGIIDSSHKPSERQKNEFRRCKEQRLREYNRPSY